MLEIAELVEMGGQWKIKTRYIPGPGVDQRVAMISVNTTTGAATAREYYHADRLGNVIAMAAENGAVTANYVYTPYGVEDYGASGNPFRYTGRRWDAAVDLYYYRARYYDPELGRFLQTDPVLYADQMNLYAYVSNNPLNLTDPTGKCPWCLGAGIGAGVELLSQLTTSEGRQAYVAAGQALANRDLAGALDAAGSQAGRVLLAAGAGAMGQIGAQNVARGATGFARTFSNAGNAQRALAAANTGGNAVVGGTVAGVEQVARNELTGDDGSVLAAVGGGAGGEALGNMVTMARRGNTQLAADASGTAVTNSRGETALPNNTHGRWTDGATEVMGGAVGGAYNEGVSRGAECGDIGGCD